MIIAQIPEPRSLFDFLLVLAFLASLGVNLLTLFKLFRNEPQRREVRFSDVYAAKEEVEYLREDFNQLREQARQDRDDILQAGEDRARKLHERIDLIIDEMPGKIIELLKNTGALS